jgi:hypothetical protein
MVAAQQNVPRRIGLLAAFAVALVAGAIAAPGAHAVQTPGPCVPLESQAWWQETGPPVFPGDSQHVHVGACFPWRQVISGTYTLDVVVKMHNEQGRWLTQVRIDDATTRSSRRFSAPTPHFQCLVKDCTFTTSVTVPTSSLSTGVHEWRVAANTAPVDSNTSGVAEKSLATSGWPVCIRSCSGTAAANKNTEFRGWYRTATPSGQQVVGYNVSRFGWTSSHDAEFPWANGAYRPVSGVWQPPIWIKNGSSEGDTEPVTRSRCWVDPDFHNGGSGTQVLNAAGPFQGRLSIDTTTLSNGLHALVCAAGSDEDGVLDGVMRLPFEVSNPLLPPLPLFIQDGEGG